MCICASGLGSVLNINFIMVFNKYVIITSLFFQFSFFFVCLLFKYVCNQELEL